MSQLHINCAQININMQLAELTTAENLYTSEKVENDRW